MTDHGRLYLIWILSTCIAALLLMYGCAGERFGRPGETTYNIFDQPWPGYKNPSITIYDNAPPQYFGSEEARLAKLGEQYFILCKQVCSKRQIEHEEAHALADLNGYTDEWHETEADRLQIRAIIAHGDDPIGDARDWVMVQPPEH